jgi:large subunit ribosomal protein L10
MNKQEKVESIASLSESLKKAKGIILAEYSGLKVSEITALRKEIKKNAADFKVVKNRLAKRAVAGTAWAPLEKYLKGPLALAISEQDPVIISKILVKFAETCAALKITAGSLGAEVMDAKGVGALAKLPSKEELYAKLLGTLMAPAQGLVRTLQGVPQKLVIALKAIADKKQQ